MKTGSILSAAVLVIAAPLTICAAVLLRDDFSAKEHPQRQIPTTRGHWTLEGGVATSAHDEELYKKNKNHGAMMWYDVTFRDATLRYSFKAEACQTVGFTLNNSKGHVFRFVQTNDGLSVRAWAAQAKDVKATALQGDEKGPKLAHGKWTEVELRFEGPKVVVRIGDYRRTFEHPGIAIEKGRFALSYDKGVFSVRDVRVETSDAKR